MSVIKGWTLSSLFQMRNWQMKTQDLKAFLTKGDQPPESDEVGLDAARSRSCNLIDCLVGGY